MLRSQVRRPSDEYTNVKLWADKSPEDVPLVEVSWRDIASISNWNEDEEVAPARHFLSVGYLLYDGPDPKDPGMDMVVIATTYDPDTERWADYQAFPKPVVRQITTLAEVVDEDPA